VHDWGHRDSVIWLEWYRAERESEERASIPLTLREGRLFIPWPPKEPREGYWVLERVDSP
jgi:hypothetical protein